MDCKLIVAFGSALMSRQTAAARNKHAAPLLGPAAAPPRRALRKTLPLTRNAPPRLHQASIGTDLFVCGIARMQHRDAMC